MKICLSVEFCSTEKLLDLANFIYGNFGNAHEAQDFNGALVENAENFQEECLDINDEYNETPIENNDSMVIINR